MPMHLLSNADLFAPEPQGVCHVLVAGERIVWIGADRPEIPAALGVEEHDLGGRRLIPGLIDPHVHLTGGGGETGYASRVPALALSTLTGAGITTAIGVLGTDDLVRTPGELVATARGLRELGLTTFCWTGGYHLPPNTITGSVRGDIVHVDLVIGVGEVAISDHRSSQPTLDEILRLAAEAHVGGLMTRKAGVLHLHLGDGERGLELIEDALAVAEVPARVFYPTHVNRRAALFEEALGLAKKGCTIDVTATPADAVADEVSAADAIERFLGTDAPSDRITASSDGGGCMATFADNGAPIEMAVGRPSALADTLTALLDRGLPLERVAPVFSTNAATLLRLPGKGRLEPGADADLVVLRDDHRIGDVMARGRWFLKNGTPLLRGPFESP